MKWFVADFIFISDMVSNSILGAKYYEIFSSYGMSPVTINTLVSILEILRIGILLYQVSSLRNDSNK